MNHQAVLAPPQEIYLSVLNRTPAERIKPFVESLLMEMTDLTVLSNRTGLVMIPYTESVNGERFHLGETLVAEARVRLGHHEGYGVCLGRDLEQALAIAILDAALQAGKFTEAIVDFVDHEASLQAEEDDLLLRQVEATRVEMETF
jgi:alpha-D-ribose 1-methylphosphonate 5-triphosphate synthase subunit PhnG